SADKDYSATSLIALPGEVDILEQYSSADEASKDLFEARDMVLSEVGKSTEPTQDDYREAFIDMVINDGVSVEDAATPEG
ncbi:hypothetical protein NL436_28235, partial [Klebsiella pneumoniae]|nr:hypothetical protein [Klebsiella pneumoniae]